MLLPLPPFLIKGSSNHPNRNHLRLPLPPSLSTTNVGSPVLMGPRSGWLSHPIALHAQLSCSHSGLGVSPLGHFPCGLTAGLPGVFQKLGLRPVPPGLRGGTYLGGGIIYTLCKHIYSLFTCFSSAFLQPQIVHSVGSETMKTE